MEFLLKIAVQDFNQDFFTSLKEVIKNFKSGEMVISIRDNTSGDQLQESAEEYEKRLTTSIEDLNSGKGIVFTRDSLEAYLKDLAKE